MNINYDNTLKIKKEADILNKIGYLNYFLEQAQKECNKRNKEYKENGFNDNFKFIGEDGNTYYIEKYDKNMGQYLVYWIYKGKKHYTYMYKNQIIGD